MLMFDKKNIRDENAYEEKDDLRKTEVMSDTGEHVHQRHVEEGSRAECERISQQVGGNERRAHLHQQRREHGGDGRRCGEERYASGGYGLHATHTTHPD